MKTFRLRCFFALGSLALPLVACGNGGNSSAPGDAGSTPVSDWPSYGHDGQNTRYNAVESIITKSNVGALVRKWDTVSTGITALGVTSTPAVVDGVVYFGDWGGMLHAVNATDGSKVWTTQVASSTVGLPAQVNDSPFVTADSVYIGGANNEVYGVSRSSGQPLWNLRHEIGSQQNTVLWSSPNVVGNTMLIGVGSFQVFTAANFTFKGNVVGVNATTGAVEWTTYLCGGNDASSGFGCSVWGSAAVDTTRGWMFIGVGQGYTAPVSPYSDSVVALDYTTGAIKWGYQYTADDIYTLMTMPNGDDYDVGASPVLYTIGSQDYVGAGDKGGHFKAMDRSTGKLLWSQELTPGGQTGGVMASPAVADGKIYVYSNNGSKGNYGTNGPASGVAFCLDGATGNIDWQVPMTPGAFGGIAIANGVMFFETLDGKIHALDADTGDELWNDLLMNETATTAAAGVSVANGMVFAGAGWQWLPTSSPAGGLTAYGLPDDIEDAQFWGPADGATDAPSDVVTNTQVDSAADSGVADSGLPDVVTDALAPADGD